MTPADFISAQKRLKISRAAFCRELGIATNTGTAYAKGRSEIPRYIALAIAALLYGQPPVGEQNALIDLRNI